MRILIDTNILIHLEDNKVIDEKFSKFYRLAITNGCKVLYHPQGIFEDISRDKNFERKKVIQSKLKKYEKLEDCKNPDCNFLSKVKNSKINDEIDNKQLYQLHEGLVDIFITQDKGIHKKSKSLNLENKVLSISDSLNLLNKKFTFIIPSHPILKEHSIRDIESKFDSSFFDSLRLDYGEENFNNWLKKCLIENRRCYSLVIKDSLQAILIYNIEVVEEHRLPSIYDKVLKICTLKVEDTAFGIKLGELFLHKMFEYCINQGIKYLYLTVYKRQIHLINLLKKFGFLENVFINSLGNEEIRMIKCLDKNKISINENHISIHPFYFDNNSIAKYVIPIRPNFYGTLFKDGALRTPTLFDSSPESVNEIQGNTIIKAYISNSKNKKLKKGDLLFFYSSQKNQTIEPVGILEDVRGIKKLEDLLILVRNKTVYSEKKLKKWLSVKGELHVIIFRLITYLKKKIDLPKIKEIDSFRNKIQTITELKEKDYIKLKNEKYFNERYIIN